MLITFTSDAFENIVMFGDVAKTLLKLMGHSGTVPGALLPGEIPQALSLLEERLKKNSKNAPTQKADDDFEEVDVSLSHRAIPLINMLKSAEKQQCPVTWDE